MTLLEGTIVADVSVIHAAVQTYIGMVAKATGAANGRCELRPTWEIPQERNGRGV